MIDDDLKELGESLGKTIFSFYSWVSFYYRRLVSWVFF
jgi:hypothetical protein